MKISSIFGKGFPFPFSYFESFSMASSTWTIKHWKWCTWHQKASAKNSSKSNKFLHSLVNLLIQYTIVQDQDGRNNNILQGVCQHGERYKRLYKRRVLISFLHSLVLQWIRMPACKARNLDCSSYWRNNFFFKCKWWVHDWYAAYSRSGLVEEDAVEVFFHYGFHLFSSFLMKNFKSFQGK